MNSTIVLGIASIVFALVFRAQSHNLPEDAQRLPVLLIWLVIGLAVLMIVEELLKRRLARRGADLIPADDGEPLAPVNWRVLGVFSCAILAYVVLIPIGGYLLITPLFIGGGLALSKTLPLPKAIVVGSIATGVVWSVFIWALNLPVPLMPSLN